MERWLTGGAWSCREDRLTGTKTTATMAAAIRKHLNGMTVRSLMSMGA